MSLQQRLDAIKKSSLKQIPEDSDAPAVMERATRALADSGQADDALAKGAEFPRFELPRPDGTRATFGELKGDGTAIVTFFRGHW